MLKKCLTIIVSAFILAFVVTGCSNENDSWAAEIQEIAKNADAVHYKYSAVEVYEREYTATIAELEKFYMNLTSSFESGEYLNIENDTAVLTNIFQAIVLANQASGGPQQFATKYLENVKYMYLGVEEPTSDQVLGNEQMMVVIMNNAW